MIAMFAPLLDTAKLMLEAENRCIYERRGAQNQR